MEALIGSWVFLGIYGLAHVAFTWLLARWFSNKELRSAREYGDELLCKEQSKRTGVELELAKARQANVDTARANGQLLRDKDQLREEIASTRKLNVEIARERDIEKQEVNKLVDERKELREQVLEQISKIEQLNEQIHNQMFTIEAFQKRMNELDKAKAELINKAMQYYVLSNECNQLRIECQVAMDERKELRQQAIDLRIDLDRNMDVFNDLAIHLQDMAAAIVSVAPDAKGD